MTQYKCICGYVASSSISLRQHKLYCTKNTYTAEDVLTMMAKSLMLNAVMPHVTSDSSGSYSSDSSSYSGGGGSFDGGGCSGDY